MAEELVRETPAGFGCDPAAAVVYNHLPEPRFAVNCLRMSTVKFGLARALPWVDSD